MASTCGSGIVHYCTVAIYVFIYLISLGDTCSPQDGTFKEKYPEEKMFYSKFFAYGTVKDIKKGGYFYESLYTVQFQVYCTFKGRLPTMINITDAGDIERYEPGKCISNDFKIGKNYYVYLNSAEPDPKTSFRTTYNEDLVTNEQILDDIVDFCDVTINYPLDANKKGDNFMCPEPLDYEHEPGDCIKYVENAEPEPNQPDVKPITTKANEVKSTGKPEPEPESESGAVSSNDGKNSSNHLITSMILTVACFVLALL